MAVSRRTGRAVENADPGMAAAVRAAAGDRAADGAVRDRAEELGVLPTAGGGMLVDRFDVGVAYHCWTSTFPYVGVVVARGVDYIELADATMILHEGRTSVFHRTGRAPGQEAEYVGRVLIPVDVLGPCRVWPHATDFSGGGS